MKTYSLGKLFVLSLVLIHPQFADAQIVREGLEIMNMNPGEAPGEEWVQSEEFLKCAACLAQKGRVRDSGGKGAELSAWLVKGENGISCVMWPGSDTDLWNPGANQRLNKSLNLSKYPMPQSTVGILHSHPANSKVVPSPEDQALAARLRMPNFVISRDGIWSYSSRTSRTHQHTDYSKIVETSKTLEKDYCKNISVVQSTTEIASGRRLPPQHARVSK